TIGTFSVPVGSVNPLLVLGSNQLGIRMSGTGASYLAWAYATITIDGVPERVEIFDENGGNNYDNPDGCNSQYTSTSLDTPAASFLCSAVSATSWSGTPPCRGPLPTPPSGTYDLPGSAHDGLRRPPS